MNIGLVYEFHTGADIGWIILTAGCVVHCVATKIKHERKG